MDFGKLLEEVQGLKNEAEKASQEQSKTLNDLQDTLQKHYAELEQQFGTLKSLQAETIFRQTAEQNGKIDALQQSQEKFLQEQSAKADALLKSHDELKATIETAQRTAQESAELIKAQEHTIAVVRTDAKEATQYLQDQLKANLEKVGGQLDELKTAVAKQDQTKRVDELQKSLDSFKKDTINSVNNLGGLVEKMKAQLETLKGNELKLRKLGDEIADLKDDIEKMNKRIETLRRGESSGPISYKQPKSRLPFIAIVLSMLAIIALIVTGFAFQRGQNALELQMRELSEQVEQLTILVEATPEPTPTPTLTPEPTPTPTATPTAAPTATASAAADATPQP